MSQYTEFIRGKAEEADGAMVVRPRAKFNKRGNDVWADRSGRLYAPGGEMAGGAKKHAEAYKGHRSFHSSVRGSGFEGEPDVSSPVTGNGMGNLSRLVGGKRRGGVKHTVGTESQGLTPAQQAKQSSDYKKATDEENRAEQQHGRDTQGTSIKEEQSMEHTERMKQDLSKAGDLLINAFPPGINTAAKLALTLNPYSEYYIPPEKRTLKNYALLGLSSYVAGKAGQYALGKAFGALGNEVGALTREGNAGLLALEDAAGERLPSGEYLRPGQEISEAMSSADMARNYAGRTAAVRPPPPPPSTYYPQPKVDTSGKRVVEEMLDPDVYGGRAPRHKRFLPGATRRPTPAEMLPAPALRGPMDPTGVGQMYSTLSPDYETIALMTKGEQAYNGGARKKGKLTAHEKQALEIQKEAADMGMSLEEHLKHNKIPAAKRRTVVKRALNAAKKTSGTGGAQPGAKKKRASARGQEVARLMREQGMTLGQASKALAKKA